MYMNKRNLFFWFCTAYFFVFCVIGLESLGLHYDEAHVGLGAANIIDSFSSKTLSGIHLPLMQNYYTGFTKDFATIPFQLLLGNTVFALRFARVVLAFLALLCVYCTTKRWFGAKTALCVFFLLSCNAVFIRCVRIGQRRDELMQMLFIWACLALLEVFRKKQSAFYALASGVCLGAGIWAKLSTLGVVAGWGIAMLCLMPASFRFVRKNVFRHTAHLAVFFVGCVFGSAALIAHNIVYEFETIPRMLAVFGSGTSSQNIFLSVAGRVKDLLELLSGTSMLETIKSTPTPLVPVLFVLATAILLVRYTSIVKAKNKLPRKQLFLIISAAGAFAAGVFAPRYKDAEHMLLVYPYVQLMIAFAFVPLYEKAKTRWAKNTFLGVLLLMACTQTLSLAQTIKQEKAGLGKGWFSNIPQQASAYMLQNNITNAVSLVPMLGPGVEFLSNRRIKITRDWEMFFEDTGKNEFFAKHMRDNPGHYLFRQEKTFEQLTDKDQFGDFETMNNALGRHYEKQAQFSSASGQTIISLYQSVPLNDT